MRIDFKLIYQAIILYLIIRSVFYTLDGDPYYGMMLSGIALFMCGVILLEQLNERGEQ